MEINKYVWTTADSGKNLQNMEKVFIRKDYNEHDLEYETGKKGRALISDFIEKLENVKQEGATHIEFLGRGWDGGADVIFIYPFSETLETDEQLQERIRHDQLVKIHESEKNKNIRKELYEKLKKEFEPNS